MRPLAIEVDNCTIHIVYLRSIMKIELPTRKWEKLLIYY